MARELAVANRQPAWATIQKRQKRRGNGGGQVLPNLLPLPRKSSPKQNEPRAIRMGYVVEIEGTIGNQTKHKSNS
jgi:hypothetical protein